MTLSALKPTAQGFYGGQRALFHPRLHVHRRRRLQRFTQGTNVLQTGDDLLQVAIDYVAANSPVGSVVEGRMVKQ